MKKFVTLDGCEAAAKVAFKTNEVFVIYPITPSSPMGEFADAWAAEHRNNLWDMPVTVQEMHSEGGAAGSVHGSLQTGALTTTFTASQGLLLMIPNMFKIAGELTSTVFHITARSLATSALSIFGDHSDVMSARATGWAMLFGTSVQEAADFALIAQSATLQARVPFMHIMDGFRTSHEVMKIEVPSDEVIRALISDDLIHAHRDRALNPDRPFIRGTAQNPDVYFQTREAVNRYYLETPQIVQDCMDAFAKETGRAYRLFDYVGAEDAERVVVAMGSACEALHETVEWAVARGEKVGLLKVRLFRPFSPQHLCEALPQTVKALAVLDRTKEPGSAGEPLYQDILTGLMEQGRTAQIQRVIGGRYGLSSKEFTPAMGYAVLEELKKDKPKNHFTIGINDDVTHTSLDYDASMQIETDDCKRAVFWGLGSDGTVGANKNTIKIIGEETDFYAQGYFVYDSKKAGARTVSHLRFGTKPIRSTYLIQSATFVGIHQFNFLYRYPVLDLAARGATVLLNSPYSAEEVWGYIPRHLQNIIREKDLQLYVVDAYKVAKDTGMGGRMNTILQTCFFAIANVLPQDQAIASIKYAIKKTYGKRGEAVVQQNIAAVDAAVEHLVKVTIPEESNGPTLGDVVPACAPDFVKNVTAPMLAEYGDSLPVSAMPADGTYPSNTTRWEKRGLALEVPEWDPNVCIQCGKCALVCPHSCIRTMVIQPSALEGAPAGFLSTSAKWKEMPESTFTLQVSTEDCTGCTLCVEVCPAKNKSQAGRRAINMTPYTSGDPSAKANWEFFTSLEPHDMTRKLPLHLIRNAQLRQPLFEFSGACAGCGETPYLKLLSQLYGDRMVIANATGCSSIYGGNLPTTPWAQNKEGRGPAWSNSLFEDNAEFGFGMRLSLNQQQSQARRLLEKFAPQLGDELVTSLLQAEQKSDTQVHEQRQRVSVLKEKLQGDTSRLAKDLLALADTLVKRSVWIIGGDGWAYDIGFGGLDHVLAQGLNVNVLVLDTQVYSNTGGQSSKATPMGAVAKFATGGKTTARKDLGLIAMSYGNIYVAQIAMGADDAHTLKAIQEAEAYEGPSLIICYAHCVAHGIQMQQGLYHQKLANQAGAWPLFRFNPDLKKEGKNPFSLDCKAPSIPLKDYVSQEGRFRILQQSDPETAERLLQLSQAEIDAKWRQLDAMAKQNLTGTSGN